MSVSTPEARISSILLSADDLDICPTVEIVATRKRIVRKTFIW